MVPCRRLHMLFGGFIAYLYTELLSVCMEDISLFSFTWFPVSATTVLNL